MSKGYEQYRQTSIQTAPPEQLIVMLYDGAGRFLEQARVALIEGRDASVPIGRAQDIFVELLTSLDRSAGEIANTLAMLYDFWIHQLFQAQVSREAKRVEEVAAMVRELRESWAVIALQQRKAAGMTAAQPAMQAPALNARS